MPAAAPMPAQEAPAAPAGWTASVSTSWARATATAASRTAATCLSGVQWRSSSLSRIASRISDAISSRAESRTLLPLTFAACTASLASGVDSRSTAARASGTRLGQHGSGSGGDEAQRLDHGQEPVDLALADNPVHAAQAACSYSCRMPPSRLRRRTSRRRISSGPATGKGRVELVQCECVPDCTRATPTMMSRMPSPMEEVRGSSHRILPAMAVSATPTPDQTA